VFLTALFLVLRRFDVAERVIKATDGRRRPQKRRLVFHIIGILERVDSVLARKSASCLLSRCRRIAVGRLVSINESGDSALLVRQFDSRTSRSGLCVLFCIFTGTISYTSSMNSGQRAPVRRKG